MKKALIIALAVLLLLTMAAAHGGRTDAKGGHYDSSAGEYHYHHGYEAHQHTNGRCPFDFDDQTDHSSGSGGGIEDGTIAAEHGHSHFPWLTMSLIALALAILVLVAVIRRKAQTRRREQAALLAAEADRRRQEQEKQDRLAQARREMGRLAMEKAHFIQGLHGRTLAQASGMPEDTELGADGLPKEKGSDHWGWTYTLYVTRTGKVYHNWGCISGPDIPIHVCQVGDRTPCLRCRPSLPELDWFWRFQDSKKCLATLHRQSEKQTEIIDKGGEVGRACIIFNPYDKK